MLKKQIAKIAYFYGIHKICVIHMTLKNLDKYGI